ncbi:MAG: hypothetical protein D6766_00825, partial [Verrucomicrobia bacterium]
MMPAPFSLHLNPNKKGTMIMKRRRLLWTGLLLAGLTHLAHGQAPVARWNLGEDDPGAAAGLAGNAVTTDAVGDADLTAFGGPVYTDTTPGGESTLAMVFDGQSFYQGSVDGNGAPLDQLYGRIDWNNVSLVCDVYPTALGTAGFSFPVSVGYNGAGIGILEIEGKWHVIHQGVAISPPGPDVVLNQWTHLELVRRDFGDGVETRLYINGAGEPAAILTGAPNTPTDFFTIGANELASRTPGDVEGQFQGFIDNVALIDLNAGQPPSLSRIAVSPGTIYEGNSLILSAEGFKGDPTDLQFIWRKDGQEVANTGDVPQWVLAGVTAADAGQYDVLVRNAYGEATSDPVEVVVEPSGGAEVAWYRMGDDDPEAFPGGGGAWVTQDALGGPGLEVFGIPLYSDDTPPDGGGYSMEFLGDSYYRNLDMSPVFDQLDLNNFSLSADVKVTELGPDGFSFVVSLGQQTRESSGFGILEVGGRWRLVHQMIALSPPGPEVVLNEWTHLELQRRQFGEVVETRLFVNGVDAGVSIVQGPNPQTMARVLTVGANTLADPAEVEGTFRGLIDNVRLKNYSAGRPPELVSDLTAEPSSVLVEGDTLVLVAQAQGDAPLTFSWQRDGEVLKTEEVASGAFGFLRIDQLTVDQAGDYQVVVSNAAGEASSSVVRVTVLPAGSPRPGLSLRFRLGDDDPGAAPGAPGNPVTVDTTGDWELVANGSPLYSDATPGGGSALCLSFDGASYCEGVGETWDALFAAFDWDHVVLSFDVNITAPGDAGFSFPVSVGGELTGLAIFEEAGHWRLLHHGVGYSQVGPEVQYNTWTHLELRRMNFGNGVETRLFVDGVDAGIANTTRLNLPKGRLTVGNNIHTTGPEGFFHGMVDNVELFTY